MPSIAFFHGWAFDSSFWGPVNLGPDWKTFVFNRGYFGEQQLFEKLEKVDLIVAHSFGLFWVPEHLLWSCKGIITLNSFRKFIPNHKVESVKARKVLHTMIRQFAENPHTTIESYYKNVFSPTESPTEVPDFIHHSLLFHDLETLRDKEFELNEHLKSKKWLILNGEKDTLISKPSQDDWDGLKAKTKQIQNGSHAIWKTNTAETVLAIRSWLKTGF